MTGKITIACVVFDAEVGLLHLQARSCAVHLDPSCVARIVVLDNTVTGLSPWSRRRLLDSYEQFADRVDIIRVSSLLTKTGVDGWRSQQAAKLVVARNIQTDYYVVFDAKNHLIRAVDESDFINPDGRAHAGMHPYSEHSLQGALRRTLAYLGADEPSIEQCVERFPVTATPFVFHTALVQQMIDDVESESGRAFDQEFERAELFEFFLYSGWVHLKGPGLDAVMDGVPIQSPTVWKSKRGIDDVSRVIDHAIAHDAASFAVHRRALAHSERNVREALARWWCSRGLFESETDARRFINRARRAYWPAMALTRGSERIGRRWAR